MKILLINNEKDGLETEWLRLLKDKLHEAEGTVVDILPYNVLDDALAYDKEYDSIVLSGREIPWKIEELPTEYRAEIALIKKSRIPILGICAGQELVGIAYGAVLGRMQKGAEEIMEEGFVDLFTRQDPIFKSLSDPCSVYMFHGDELKNVPEGFVKIAESKQCNICGIRHKDKPVYGIQFHPEKYTADFPDGKIVFKNFADIVSNNYNLLSKLKIK